MFCFNLTFILQLQDNLVLPFPHIIHQKTTKKAVFALFFYLHSWPLYFSTWNWPYLFNVSNQKEQFEDYLTTMRWGIKLGSGDPWISHLLIKVALRCRVENSASLCLTRKGGCRDQIICNTCQTLNYYLSLSLHFNFMYSVFQQGKWLNMTLHMCQRLWENYFWFDGEKKSNKA